MKRLNPLIAFLSFLLCLTACDSDVLVSPILPKETEIVVLTPAQVVGEPAVITTSDNNNSKGVLYYWMLGDDSSFSASQDTVRHIYREPGYYTISLTIRNANDFSVVSRDSALIEILDTNYRAPDFLHQFTRVEVRIRAVFTVSTYLYISNKGKYDTTLLDTMLSFGLTHSTPITWFQDSFYVGDGKSESNQTGGTSYTSGSTGSTALGRVPYLNNGRALKFSLGTGEGSFTQGNGGYTASDNAYTNVGAHLIPLITASSSDLLFRAQGRNSLQHLRTCSKSIESTRSYSGHYREDKSSYTIAPVEAHNDSAFVEVRFFK